MDRPEEICQQDVDDLRQLNGKLIDNLKQRMVDIHKLAIEVVDPEEPP